MNCRRHRSEGLVVDEALLGIGRSRAGYPEAVAVLVDRRRHDVVVEAAPVVPGEEDGRRAPARCAHHEFTSVVT